MTGMAPGPRASFNMVGHRQRAILFGGITDQPGKVCCDISSQRCTGIPVLVLVVTCGDPQAFFSCLKPMHFSALGSALLCDSQ